MMGGARRGRGQGGGGGLGERGVLNGGAEMGQGETSSGVRQGGMWGRGVMGPMCPV